MPTYLVFPNQAAALARSNQQALANGCDGINTIYWWNVVPLTNGQWAIELQDGGPFSAIYCNALEALSAVPVNLLPAPIQVNASAVG